MALDISGGMPPISDIATSAGKYLGGTSATGNEQLYSPVIIRRGNNPSAVDGISGFEVQIADGNSQGKYAGNHLGLTRTELDPYFSNVITGDSSDFIQECDYTICMNDGTGNGGRDLNIRKVNRSSINAVTVSHFRGPMVVSGWGADLADRPVPSFGDVFTYNAGLVNNRGLWKSGPVDLRWDYQRKVWSMGHHMIAGIASTKIEAPTQPCNPTYFKIKVLRTIEEAKANLKWALGESATITNRDPSLTQELVGDLVWVVAARVNYEWLPVWVGCPEENAKPPEAACAAQSDEDPPEQQEEGTQAS